MRMRGRSDDDEGELATRGNEGEEDDAEASRGTADEVCPEYGLEGSQAANEDDEKGDKEEDRASCSDDDEYDEAALRKAYDTKGGDANEGLDKSDVAWVKRLEEWMACFNDASIKWRQVNMLGDGKLRPGLAVILKADVEAWDGCGAKKTVNLVKLREAIDLARLLVDVKPAVMVSTIRTLEGWGMAMKCSEYEDELQALLRGVPVEIRVVLRHSALKTLGMDTRLAQHFFHDLDHKAPSNKGFVSTWKDLELLLLRKHSLDDCNHVLGTPVNVVVSIDSSESRGAPEPESEQFFAEVLRFVERLHEHQQQQATKALAIDRKHLALRVDKIKLTLRSLCVTPRIQRCVTAIMTTGIPVKCSNVTICPRHIVNHQPTVQAFVDALATSAIDVTTETAVCVDPMDTDGKDHTQLIRMVIDVIASVEQLNRVCLSGLLKLYGSRHNREAVWRGLFAVVLSRSAAINNLTFAPDCQLTTEDTTMVTKFAAMWRRWNPGKKLCLRKLHIGLRDGDSDALLALLAAFDDVQHLCIEDNYTMRRQLPHETLVCALQYPSLRLLAVESVAVESMDVFDATITDPRLPSRPVLEEIDLQHVTIADKDSLRRFIGKLAPRPSSSSPHPRATSLRRLVIDQKNRTVPEGAIFDNDIATALHEVLLQNSVLEHVHFIGDENDRSTRKHRQQFLVHNGRPVRASSDKCRSEIMKARHWAFLSVLQKEEHPRSGLARAMEHVDSHILRLIFAFSAPHVYRHVGVGESSMDEDNDWVDEM